MLCCIKFCSLLVLFRRMFPFCTRTIGEKLDNGRDKHPQKQVFCPLGCSQAICFCKSISSVICEFIPFVPKSPEIDRLSGQVEAYWNRVAHCYFVFDALSLYKTCFSFQCYLLPYFLNISVPVSQINHTATPIGFSFSSACILLWLVDFNFLPCFLDFERAKPCRCFLPNTVCTVRSRIILCVETKPIVQYKQKNTMKRDFYFFIHSLFRVIKLARKASLVRFDTSQLVNKNHMRTLSMNKWSLFLSRRHATESTNAVS